MPIYEYRCDACAHELEALQKMSDAPLKECPECGKESLIKKVSAAAFRLKGSGWYETDFKSGNKKNLASAESGGEGKSEGKSADGKGSDKKAEAKPAKDSGKTTGASSGAPAKKSES